MFLTSCNEKRNQHNENSMKNDLKVFTLTNSKGNKIKVTNYGAKIMSIIVPDKTGNKNNVVLGYDSKEEYLDGDPYFGAAIGRYANRIAEGKFDLDDKTYELPKNDNQNHLHGGPGGFNNVIWEAKKIKHNDSEALELSYLSKDGEEGYPGNMEITMVYTWTDDNELRIEYTATTDKKTIINLTHHSFFNLKDGGKSKITEHEMSINADNFLPVDSSLIPTGEIKSVKDTPMDFTKPKKIGADINADYDQLKKGKGYDHNWVLNKPEQGKMTLAAKVKEPETGRIMVVYTTEPGLQFYSGNFLDGEEEGRNDIKYKHRTAFCLEAQHFPDSPNQPEFPSTVLRPGEKYKQTTIYKFLTE
jgi:aldose 1-epimerase